MDFKSKVVLITGASSGIGKQTAIEFAKLGANIVLVARRKDKLEQVENELKEFHTSVLSEVFFGILLRANLTNKSQVMPIGT